jgi:hypothetical protein
MKIWKPILATVLFVAMSLTTPLFYRWYQSYFEVSGESIIGVIFTAVILYVGSLALLFYTWMKHFNIDAKP